MGLNHVRWCRWSSATMVVLFTLLAGVAASACSGGNSGSRPDSENGSPPALRVVVSTTVIADWVAQVGGDAVEVSALVPLGADAHTVQLTPRDVIQLAAADLIVLSGAGLEAGFRAVIAENTEAPVLDLAAGLDLNSALDQEASDTDRVDPHYWLDAGHAIAAVALIAQALGSQAPALASDFGDRATTFRDLISAADEEIAGRLRALTDPQRTLVTFHDAFGYFARRYDLEILGFVVEGPEEEPSAKDIANLVAAMRERGARVIFTEPQFSARVVEQVANETDATIRILHSQLSEAAPTYLALLRANAAALTDAQTETTTNTLSSEPAADKDSL
jgi:ABC-type Zn uptake system ZnuABC Zn-binding protein ZnuA